MTPKLYKAADVCDIAQLQPYVLRSWEKEFPGIGVQSAPDGPRVYRQADVDQVLRIKQLVFGEGLTLSGARKRLDMDPTAAAVAASATSAPAAPAAMPQQRPQSSHGDGELRTRMAHVRDGLRGILDLLSAPGEAVGHAAAADEYQLAAPAEPAASSKVRKLTDHRAAESKAAPVAKRKRASA